MSCSKVACSRLLYRLLAVFITDASARVGWEDRLGLPDGAGVAVAMGTSIAARRSLCPAFPHLSDGSALHLSGVGGNLSLNTRKVRSARETGEVLGRLGCRGWVLAV